MSDHGHSHGASGECESAEHHGHGHGHGHGHEHAHGRHAHGHGQDVAEDQLVAAVVAAVDNEGVCVCCDEGVCACCVAMDANDPAAGHGHATEHGHGHDHGHEHEHEHEHEHGHGHGDDQCAHHADGHHADDHGDHGHSHGDHGDGDDDDAPVQGNETKLKVMLVLTLAFFIAEITVGYMCHSLALVADSFHMLSDAFALVIGLVSVRLSKKDASNQFTFGWVRAEVVGALINGVFLLAVCFSICMESIERFVEIEEIEKPELLLGVGLGGLAINLFGMFLFSGHAHSHGGGGHGHSHGGSGKQKADAGLAAEVRLQIDDHDDHDDHGHGHGLGASSGSATSELDAALRIQAMNPIPASVKVKEAGDMNMHGVFLHLLGDFLGSVAVVITALVVWKCENWAGRHYLDPILSLVIVAIIMAATIPLVRDSALVLMQTTPTNVDLAMLRAGVNRVGGVLGTHELHVWSLTGATLVASVHVTFKDAKTYVKAAPKIKDFFHVNGIHSLTLQPEFIGKNTHSFNVDSCLLPCADDSCEPDSCCPASDDQLGSLNARRSFVMPALVRHSRASRSPSPAASRSPSRSARAAAAERRTSPQPPPSGLDATVTAVTSRGNSKLSSV